MVVEKYPNLKANENYLKLQESIVDCEDNLAAARRVYNTIKFILLITDEIIIKITIININIL